MRPEYSGASVSGSSPPRRAAREYEAWIALDILWWVRADVVDWHRYSRDGRFAPREAGRLAVGYVRWLRFEAWMVGCRGERRSAMFECSMLGMSTPM